MVKDFDLVILGWGAAAFSAAIRASELTSAGATIVMIGRGPIGGTCVNVGCVPSKYLLEASHQVFNFQHPKMPGIAVVEARHDFGKVMEGLRSYVDHARSVKYDEVIRSYKNVTLIEGLGTFLDNKTVRVEGSAAQSEGEVSGSQVLVATGSTPTVPKIDGLKDAGFLTSDSLWGLSELPRRVAIIGGGSIGLEMGQALLHFGAEVAVVEAQDSLLPQGEPEIGEALKARMEREGMRIHLRARVGSAGRSPDGKYVEVITHAGRHRVDVDEIIVATGRRPNTDTLNLNAAGVKTDERGLIVVDRAMRTSSPGIYAAGDCVSKSLFLETLAAREGVVAVSNMFGQEAEIDYDSATWAVFTHPQVAGVGMTEAQFSRKNGSCSFRTLSLANLTKATIMGEADGLIKVTVDPRNNKVMGMHIFSPNATDIITEGAYAVQNGYTVEDIIATSHIFPSLSEGVKLAAQSFIRDLSKMSCCVE